jgi:HK97 family phage major capsid protein
MSSATMNTLTQVEDSLGRPLINTNIAAGLTSTLLGRPIVFNEDLPAPSAGTKPIVFGDPKSYLIRTVGTPRLIRLNELYAGNGQVGFLMVGRAAARILDAGTHPLKALEMAAS